MPIASLDASASPQPGYAASYASDKGNSGQSPQFADLLAGQTESSAGPAPTAVPGNTPAPASSPPGPSGNSTPTDPVAATVVVPSAGVKPPARPISGASSAKSAGTSNHPVGTTGNATTTSGQAADKKANPGAVTDATAAVINAVASPVADQTTGSGTAADTTTGGDSGKGKAAGKDKSAKDASSQDASGQSATPQISGTAAPVTPIAQPSDNPANTANPQAVAAIDVPAQPPPNAPATSPPSGDTPAINSDKTGSSTGVPTQATSPDQTIPDATANLGNAKSAADSKLSANGSNVLPTSAPAAAPRSAAPGSATAQNSDTAANQQNADAVRGGQPGLPALQSAPPNPAPASPSVQAATQFVVGPISPTAGNTDVGDGNRGAAASANPDVNIGAIVPAQAVAAATSASTVRPSEAISAPVPITEIAVTIAAQAHAGSSQFEIRLDPPDLGRINVQLNVDNSGNVSSRMIVERPETLALLRQDAPQLERALQNAGLNAGGMQFSLADQGFAGRNGFAPQNDFQTPPTTIGTDDASVQIAALQGYGALSGRSGGLDIRV